MYDDLFYIIVNTMLRAEGPAEVLLVALEGDVGGAVAHVLRRDHYGVSVVNTCESALARIVDRRPSLVIVCPPEADQKSLDICRQLRFWCAGPLMVVARECSADNAEQALSAGADEFFAQPLRKSELLARVRALLRRCGRASAHAEEIRVGAA